MIWRVQGAGYDLAGWAPDGRAEQIARALNARFLEIYDDDGNYLRTVSSRWRSAGLRRTLRDLLTEKDPPLCLRWADLDTILDRITRRFRKCQPKPK